MKEFLAYSTGNKLCTEEALEAMNSDHHIPCSELIINKLQSNSTLRFHFIPEEIMRYLHVTHPYEKKKLLVVYT